MPSLHNGFSQNPSWTLAVPQSINLSDMKSPPVYQEDFVPPGDLTMCVHSPAIVELGNGDLLAVWYGGTREGAKDVMIYQSVWDKDTGGWSEAKVLTGALQTQADLRRYIRKVGNPVLLRDTHGKIWLFYVSVSVGGWSGSSINYCTSADNGAHWSTARRLVTTPFMNVSTLVRGKPFLYSNGSIGLPIYHELIGKFGELLRLGTDGSVLDKTRISWGRMSLQPSIVLLDTIGALAFLRDTGSSSRRILYASTKDGGRTWSRMAKLRFPNPDSSVMGLRVSDGSILLVFNNSEKGRNNLSLARSQDNGNTWKVLHVFEEEKRLPGEGKIEFSYPSLIQASDGVIHLLYTWNIKRIKHVYFNLNWLTGLKEQS